MEASETTPVPPDQTAQELSQASMDGSAQQMIAFAMRSAQIGTFVYDIPQQRATWSPELEALYHAPPGSFGATHAEWLRHIAPEDVGHVDDVAQRAARGESAYDVEFRVIWPDGTVRWMQGKGDFIRDATGNPQQIIGVNIDITDRKILERNLAFLAQASKLLSSSLDFATIWENLVNLAVPYIADWCAVDVLNDQGVFDIVAIKHVDPAKVALVREHRQMYPTTIDDSFGLPEIIRTQQHIFIPEISDELNVAIARSPRELEILRLLGMTSTVSIPLIVRGNAIGAITLVTSDTHKRFTEAQVTMAQELASRASLALENATLYAQAQRATELRDDFIAAASHELKTPITSLKMHTQMLQRQAAQAGDSRLTTSLTKIDTQTTKLVRLVNDLLDVTRLQHGQLTLQSQWFDLRQVVDEIVDGLRVTFPARDIVVIGALADLVWGDPDRISMVITNLLLNALKFSPATQPVQVDMTEADAGVQVAVRDFGIGIAPEYHDTIFERFYRVSGKAEQTFPGLGIGLYIAQAIVTRHGGALAVQSALGEGATFSVTLPHRIAPNESGASNRK